MCLTQGVDWNIEYLDLTIGIKVVSNIGEAIRFINTYGKGHSEGIIAKDEHIIKQFTQSINSAGIFINCSTRFHDGYEFGFGGRNGNFNGQTTCAGTSWSKRINNIQMGDLWKWTN